MEAGVGAVDTHGDDTIVRQPLVFDRLHVGFAVQFHAEHGFVVHSSDNPVAGLVPIHPAGVVDARRGSLIDEIGSGKGVVVMAQGEVADSPLFLRNLLALGGALRRQ